MLPIARAKVDAPSGRPEDREGVITGGRGTTPRSTPLAGMLGWRVASAEWRAALLLAASCMLDGRGTRASPFARSHLSFSGSGAYRNITS